MVDKTVVIADKREHNVNIIMGAIEMYFLQNVYLSKIFMKSQNSSWKKEIFKEFGNKIDVLIFALGCIL